MNNFAVKSTKCGKSLWSVYEGLAFQSTPPLGRRHFFGNIVVFDIPISIHASAREATIFRCPTPGHNHFNPRLREGGDAEKLLQGQSAFDFNPRLREGGDKMVERTISLHRISIHASAREATGRQSRSPVKT